MLKTISRALIVFVSLILPIAANADVIVDTGPGGNFFGGIIVDQNQSVAGQFTLADSATLSSVEGWMVSFLDATYTIAIHSDTVNGPGPVVFAETFVATGLGFGGGLPTWQGVFNQDWDLPAGTYWASFSTSDFDGGAMPSGAPNPLAAYAADTFGGGWQIIPSSSSPSYGVRISALDESPEALLEELAVLVNGEGPGNSLSNKIILVQAYLAVPDEESACLTLDGFLNQVRAQRGKKLTVEQADEFTADAETIIAAIGCD